MCGIAGIIDLNGQAIGMMDITRFTDAMSHRGPDGAGYEVLNNQTVALGHRRLSILDLTDSAKQPMAYANKRYWITYNGEVYNFNEIKKELSIKGHSFHSHTDTEVILAAYVEWGKGSLQKFNGMFAFAIWDDTKKHLFLARDRFGIKPVYYSFKPGALFAFASETNAFKALKGFNRSINSAHLQLVLDDTYALEGQGLSLFNDIQLLPAAHYLEWSEQKGISIQKWFDLEQHLHQVPNSIEEQAAMFYDLFRDACRIRLISDVPVATALSGGLDSSAVYSTIFDIIQYEQLDRVPQNAQTAFSAIFRGMPNDEQAFAQKAIDYTKGPIEWIESNQADLINTIQSDTIAADFIHTSPISSIANIYAGMKQKGFTVSLDGHGVDEMLFGYRDMVYDLYNQYYHQGNTSAMRKIAQVLVQMYPLHAQEKINKELSQNIQSVEAQSFIKRWIKSYRQNSQEKDLCLYETMTHTLPSLLRNFDKASMINGVEIRMPFLDWRLVAFCASLPIESKIGEGYTKRILRQAMVNKMSEQIRTRTFKVGISSPIHHWLNHDLKVWAIDTLSHSPLKHQALSEYQSGELSHTTAQKVWQQINLQLIQ